MIFSHARSLGKPLYCGAKNASEILRKYPKLDQV